MTQNACKVHRIKDNEILFGKKSQDTSFVYRQNDDKSMTFLDVNDIEMKSFYQYIDSKFIDIIQGSLPWICEKGEVSFEECSDFLIEQNPLQLEKSFTQRFYSNIMTKFASNVSLYSENDFLNTRDNYNLVEIQHSKMFVKHYPIHMSLPYVLMPYCMLSVKKIEDNNGIEDNTIVKLKPIVRYKDKTAPTKLGLELSEVLDKLSVNPNSIYERVSKMSIMLYDKYQHQ